MSARQQWRITFASATGSNGVCFVDAETEEGARSFFALMLPTATLTSIKLEPVDPCIAYEPRNVSASSVPGTSNGSRAPGEANGRSTTADDAELSRGRA